MHSVEAVVGHGKNDTERVRAEWAGSESVPHCNETVWAQGRWNKQKRYMQAQSSDKASTRYQAMGLSIWVENMEMEEP